eukprot:3341279-Pleurochrysis_carterae.AAC.3
MSSRALVRVSVRVRALATFLPNRSAHVVRARQLCASLLSPFLRPLGLVVYLARPRTASSGRRNHARRGEERFVHEL